jgi:hypothetical protein
MPLHFLDTQQTGRCTAWHSSAATLVNRQAERQADLILVYIAKHLQKNGCRLQLSSCNLQATSTPVQHRCNCTKQQQAIALAGYIVHNEHQTAQ